MSHVTSNDGIPVGYERAGTGAVVILAPPGHASRS